MTSHSSAAEERFYLGTYTRPGGSEGIYTGVMDAETGRLGPVTLAAPAHNPTYVALAPGGRYLYAVDSANKGSVAAYAVRPDGTLGLLNCVTAAEGACHVSVHPSGRYVFAANYSDGSMTCIRTRGDGSLGEVSASVKFTGSGPNLQRQTHPYGHSVYADATGRFIYACDLGSDRVWTFRFDVEKGLLQPALPPAGVVPAGSGPRHLAFGPGENLAYVNGEMGRNVTTFKRNAATGELTPLQTLPALPGASPDPKVTTAEIICHPSGKWVYLSSRGDDVIAAYAVRQDGTLDFMQSLSAAVKIPRGLGLDPAGKWLLACGQADGGLALFRIDPESGKLALAHTQSLGGSPVSVSFVPVNVAP